MDEQPNPYEPPQVPAESEMQPAITGTADGWRFFLLAFVILIGFISFFPLLAALFLVLSTPVFVRYLIEHPRVSGQTGTGIMRRIAQVAATAGFGIGVFAAGAGAFLGSCTVTTLAIVTPAIITRELKTIPHELISFGAFAGSIVGLFMFGVVVSWLKRRPWLH